MHTDTDWICVVVYSKLLNTLGRLPRTATYHRTNQYTSSCNTTTSDMVILTEKKAFKEVPDSRENWLHAARALRVSKASINTAKNLHSASKTVQAQYLLYRTHRLPVIHPEDMDLFTMSLDTATAQAANWLSQYAPFNAYVQSVRDESGITPEGPTDPRNLGIFEVPRALQLQAQSVDNTADAEEETVNSGLLALLVALTVKHPSPIGAWMVRRIGLTATFAKDKFVARLDGYLRSVAEGKTAILVEVKRSERARHEPQVSMQETSEIVAWIKETGLQEAEHR